MEGKIATVVTLILMLTTFLVYTPLSSSLNVTNSTKVVSNANLTGEKQNGEFVNQTKELTLSSNVLFPNRTLTIQTNFKPSQALIQNPIGKIFKLEFVKCREFYVSKFRLRKDVVLGNYTVVVDGIVKHFVVDYYSIKAKFNGTAIVGKIRYYFVPPKLVQYVIDNRTVGDAKVENGSFTIDVPFGNHVVSIRCGNAEKTLKVTKIERKISAKRFYFVNETVVINSTFKPSKAFVLTPSNGKINLTFVKMGKNYSATFTAKEIGKYVVCADNIKLAIFVDSYEINASINGSRVVGVVSWHFVKPKFVYYVIDSKTGKVEVRNGKFEISLPKNATEITLRCGNAVASLKRVKKLEVVVLNESVGFLNFKTLFNGKSVKARVFVRLNGHNLNVSWKNGTWIVRYEPKNGLLRIVAEYCGERAVVERKLNLSINYHVNVEGKTVRVFGNVTFNGEKVEAKVTASLGNETKSSQGFFNFKFNASVGHNVLKIKASYHNLTSVKIYEFNVNPVTFNVKVSKRVWINGTSLIPCRYEIDNFNGSVCGKFNLSFDLPSGKHEVRFVCGNYTLSKEFEVGGRIVTVGNLYFPNETVKITTDFKPSKAFIQDPVGNLHTLKFTRKNGRYVAEFKLRKDVVLGNYTVVVDGIVRHFVVDSYSIEAKFNGTAIVGKVRYYFIPPKRVCYRILNTNLKGCVNVVKGTFVIPVKFGEVLIECGNAKTIVNITPKKAEFLRIAFDPIEKKVVVIGTDKKVEGVLSKLKKFCKNMKLKKLVKGYISLDVVNLPAKSEILKLLNISESVLNTKVTVKRLSKTKIRLEVRNKVETWYRFSVKIPEGYRVKEIVRDDGKVIRNTVKVDRITGKKNVDIRWYVKNGTLYFYDDPIWGYNITLTPPQPNKSIAVELAYDGPYAGPGQISAIVYPYNSTDDSTTIASHDHAGRTEDNWANDIDIDAGSKIAINFTLNGVTYQYGNWYYYLRQLRWFYFSRYDTLGKDGNFTPINRTYVNINTAPNGVLESVVVDNFTTNGNEVDIIQKTIIRGDNKWFATIYYIKPLSGNLTNVRFFQGMNWNFNGDWRYSSCYYNSTYDVVYGHYNGTLLNEIEYGGYSAYIPSSAHDVGYYTDITGWGNTLLRKGIWGNISRNALSNNTFYDGDAATALAWDKPTLNQFEVWVIPIIWGFGYTFEDMVNEIQKGKSMLYDTGIKSIDFPENDSSFNPNTTSRIYVNATVALYGLVDVWNLNVTINVTQLDGTYTYENYTFVNLSVPFNETAQVSFPIDISSMPYGTYKITIKTNLPNDQNTTNDEKWIIIHIASFTVEPDQTKVGKAGEEILYNVTAYNYYSAGRFDVNITQSTKGWITRLYDNGTIVAEDSDGDGLWDYVNSSYDTNGNRLPDVYIPYGVSNVTVSKVIPPNAPLGEVDYTTLDFVSVSNTAIHDDVTLTTKTPPPPTAQKTFYLHDISLNTTSPNLESPTPVSPNSLFSWQQIPKFADNFNVVGSIVIPLWLNSTYLSTHTVTVSLFYTDGVTSYTLGSQTKTVTLSTIPQLEIFNITLTSQTVIPMGYYLILRVENTQTTATIYIFHSQYYPSNITLNTTTYVKVQSVTTNKTEYKVKETALILANVTDPIGSYDITNANITVYYPNGTLYISDIMNLNAIDSSVPSLWKLYDYTLYLPVSGIYNGTICGIESNGVAFCQRFNISVTPIKIVGRIFEDLGALGLPYNPSEDRLVPNVTVALFKDNETAGIQGVLDGNDTLVAITTTNSSGYYNFTINDTAMYFVAVNSRTVNTTRGLNSGYTINNIWAEQTFVVTWNGTAYENQTKFGGVNAEISDNWSAGIYDDYAIVNASTYNGESIDFGFSFDVIVNTRDEGQGSIGQFILNANAIKGDDRAEFRIPTTDPNYQNGVFTISLSEGDLPTIEDANTTIDGSTQPVGVIEINANYCTAINTTAYNTTIANITISNFYYGVKATQNGCDGLRMENVTFEGNATGVAIYLEDTNWDFQQFKTIVDKVTINVKGNYIYGIQLVNRIWLDLSNSFINVSGGVGIYWINYANDYAKLNVTNVTVENCNHGIYLNGSNNATFENVTVVDSTYEGVFISNSRDVEFTNSTFENNSVGLYSSSSSIELINGTLTNNRFEGIQLRNSNLESKSSLIERNSVGINAISSTLNVSDSLVIDNIYEGIVINDTESNLSNVTATNNTYGIYVESKNVSIIDSKTFENRLSGIYVVNSTNVVVDSVQSSNNNEDGLNIYNSSYITVANSTFIGNNDSGISTYDNVTNLTIYNCSFINNGNFNIGNTYSYSGVAMSVPYEKVAENVTIANCIFENNGYANVSNKGMGILIYSEGQAQNFTIEDNFINASWRDGIFVRGINNLRIENNTVTYNGQVGGDPAGSGIKVVGNDSLNVYIANNNCSYNEDNGISVEGSGNRYLKNVTIYNNTLLHNGIDANDGNALFIGGRVVNVLVKGNIMKFSDAQAILIQEPYGWLQQDWIGSNITIEGNLMEWNGLTIQSGNTTAVITVGAYGSYYQDDGYIVIEGNTFLNNSLCPNSLYGGKMGGIEIYGLNNTSVDLTFVVKNNTIVNCTAYGIDVSYSRNVLIENNTVRECEVGVAVVEQSYNVTIVNNSIYNNTFLGIDLNLDNVTLNDGILNVNQPNYGIDYPVITYAEFNGTYLYVEGYIGSNFSNATVDIYLVKNSTGGDNLIGNNVSSNGSLNDSYGEGWMYLGRLMANSSGDFEGWINVEGKGVENYALITSTATLNGIGTSEFGPDYLIVKKVNVTVGITAFWQNDHLNVTVTVKPYRDLRNINVYWIKPENVTVINVSGDYDANVTLGNYYSWEFYSLSAGEIKRIYINATISGEVSLVNVYNIGVDPKVIG